MATPVTPTPTGSIAGVVTAGGKPLAGVTVTLDVSQIAGATAAEIANPPKFTTSAAGAYSFHYLPVGTFGISVAAPAGYAATPEAKVTVATAGQAVTCNVVLAPVATPAVVTEAASTLPGILCGFGSAAAVTPTYTLSATGLGWFDISAHAATRTTRVAWSTGAGYPAIASPKHTTDPVAYPAPTISPDTCLSALSIPVVYDVPGTYQLTVAVSPTNQSGGIIGPPVLYGQTVVRPADNRATYYFAANGNDANAGTQAAPLLSYAKLATLAKKNDTRIVIVAPYEFPWGSTLSIGSRTTIEGLPTSVGLLPVIDFGSIPTCAIIAGTGCADAMVRRLEFTASGIAPANGITTAPSGANGARAQVLLSYGAGVLVDECVFGTLVRAVEQDAGDACGVTRCTQLDPLAINGQTVSTWGGSRLVVALNVLTGCTGEAPIRIDGVGTGFGVDSNFVKQSNPTATGSSGKACVDVRAAKGGIVANNAIVGAQESYTTGHGANSCGDVLSTGNVYRPVGASPGTSVTTVRGGVVGLTAVANDYDGAFAAGTAAVWVEPDGAAMQDVVVGPNKVPATLKSVYLYGATSVPGLVTA